MKYRDNIEDILRLKPDFLGFIFYKNSKRYISSIPDDIDFGETSKVGVFVDEELEIVMDTYYKNELNYVQLHGNESLSYCKALYDNGVNIIKAFAVDKDFDFEQCYIYDELVDIYLFDAKGKLPGGNGIAYDWSVLANYHGNNRFLLSGGINPDDINRINLFNHDKYMGIDINSGFELTPGFKILKDITGFIDNFDRK